MKFKNKMQQHHGISSISGFSLIELMIVLVVIVIVASVAVPQMSSFSANSAADALSRELQLDITFGRNQAVSNSQTVLVRPLADNWNQGWEVVQNGTVLRSRGTATNPKAKNGTITSGYTQANPITFDRRGRSSASDSIRIAVAGCKGDRTYTLSINNIGQIMVARTSC